MLKDIFCSLKKIKQNKVNLSLLIKELLFSVHSTILRFGTTELLTT